MPDAPKSPAQVACDALNRRRKPLIKFDERPADAIIKAKDEEIAVLARQIKDLQTDRAHKEAYIRELEGKVLQLQQAPKVEPQLQTEEIPEQPGQRRSRRPAAASQPAPQPQPQKPEQGKQGEEPKEQPQQPEAKPEPPKPAAPVRPGDGIAEED